MCGRYGVFPVSLSRDGKEVMDQLGLDLTGAINQRDPQYNIAPTQRAPVIFQGEHGAEIHACKWELMPSWAKDTKDAAKRINARVETVAKLPSFRAAFKKRRCLVPMSAYYEWKGDKPPKQPYLIHHPDGSLILPAGLLWRDPADFLCEFAGLADVIVDGAAPEDFDWAVTRVEAMLMAPGATAPR